MNTKFLMIPRTKKLMPVLFAAIFLLPFSAGAAIKEGSIELSPFVGYNFFENKQNLKDRPFVGGRIGYNITNRFGIEGAMEFINSGVDDENVIMTRKGQFTSPIGGVDIRSYHLDALYHFMPEGRFNPFLVAGAGVTHYKPAISDKEMASVNFGVGAKYWVADNVALRFDLRDNLVSEVFNDRYHNLSATAGLVFAFGGKSSTSPTPVAKAVSKPVEVVAAPKVEPVKVVAPAPIPAEKVITLAFEDIHFDHNKSTLNPEAKELLKQSIATLRDNPGAKVRIAGYTSASGSKEYNQELSEKRAQAVRDYLIDEGIITPNRLSTIGYGQTRPAEYESAPKEINSDAAKANMRVLFEIIVEN